MKLKLLHLGVSDFSDRFYLSLLILVSDEATEVAVDIYVISLSAISEKTMVSYLPYLRLRS